MAKGLPQQKGGNGGNGGGNTRGEWSMCAFACVLMLPT